MKEIVSKNSLSPFHHAEKTLQSYFGVRDSVEKKGQRVIREHLIEQHQEFYNYQRYLFLSFLDSEFKPCIGLLIGKPGFITMPNDKTIVIQWSRAVVNGNLESLKIDSKFAVLGIDFSNGRRNRLSALITKRSGTCIIAKIVQSFGNCSKNIIEQPSVFYEYLTSNFDSSEGQELDNNDSKTINSSRSFILSTSNLLSHNLEDTPYLGLDISHRGGDSGFVMCSDQNEIRWKEIKGNGHFNTLGNLTVNDAVSFMFFDYQRKLILLVQGTATVKLESDIRKNEIAHIRSKINSFQRWSIC